MNWKKVRLGEVCNVFNGKTPSKNEQKSKGLPVLKIKDVDEFKNFRGVFDCFVDKDLAAKHQSKIIKYKDILILNAAHSSTHVASKMYLTQRTVVGALATGEWAMIRTKEYHCPDFIFYFLNSTFGKNQLKDIVKGIHLYPKDISRIEIPLPDLSTQKHIAAVLDKADALRQHNRQLLAHYDELLQSTFIELFGKMNPEYSKWNTFKIEEIAESKKGSMRSGPFGSDLLHSEFVNSGIFVLGIDNVVSNKFELAKMRYITPEKYEKLKRYTVYSGDLLISIMATVGRVAIVPENMPLSINSKHLAAITLDKSKVEPIFVAYNLHSNPEVTKQITARGRGAIMEGLNLGLIKGIEIKVPPLPLQQHFAKIVEQIEAQKEAVRQSLAESEALFEGLLAGYFGAS